MKRSNDNIFQFKWVTDPYDINIEPIQKNIIQILNSGIFDIISSYSIGLYQGLIESEYIVKLNFNINKIGFDNQILDFDFDNPEKYVQAIIGKIEMDPLTFTMNKDLKFDSNETNLKGALSIIKEYTSMKMNINVTNVEYSFMESESGSFIVFTPYNKNNPIYINRDFISQITAGININILRGYHVLSSDPLCKLAIEIYIKEKISDLNLDSLRFYKNMYLYKCNNKDKNGNVVDYVVFQSIRDNLTLIIESLKSEGYFTLPFDSNENYINEQNRYVYAEIAKMWRGKVIKFETETPMIIKSEIKFSSISAPIWYYNAMNSILDLKLPKYRIYDITDLRWQRTFKTSVKEIKIRLSYTVIKAYASLILKYPILAPYFNNPKVYDDLSIEASFSSYEQVESYKELLRSEMYQDSHTILRYKLLSVNNLIDGIAVRWFFSQYRNDLKSLIIDNDDGIFVLLDTQVTENIPSIDSNKISVLRENLENFLKSYLKICDPLSIYSDIKQSDIKYSDIESSKINDLNLEQLLYLIPIFEQDNAICISSKILDQMDVLINPLTGQLLDNKIISLYRNIEWGYKGYFTVGKLKGLLESPPIKYSIPIEIGESEINSIIDNKSQNQIFIIEIIFFNLNFINYNSDEKYSYIFELDQNKTSNKKDINDEDYGVLVWLMNLTFNDKLDNDKIEKELKVLIDRLWKNSWFLSDWAISFYQKRQKMSRVDFIHNFHSLYKEDLEGDEVKINKLLNIYSDMISLSESKINNI